MAYFATNLLDIRRKAVIPILCFILIAAAPLNIVAQYGNQAVDYWSPSYEAGVHYVGNVRSNTNYPFAYLKWLRMEDNQLAFGPKFPGERHYFALSQHDDAVYDFLFNQPRFVDHVWAWLRSSDNYNRIYTNPEFDLYIHEE